MAVFTNMEATNSGKHGVFESSRIKATDCGHIYDVVFNKDVDNGVMVCVKDYTGNGLQERNGEVAKITDKVAITGTPAIVKSAMTKGQEQPYNFYNKKGANVKCYELVEEDIFGIADYQFDNTSISTQKVKVGNCVVVDGSGAYTASDAGDIETKASTNGFVGRIHSISAGSYFTIVRVEVVQNKAIGE